jgi:dTDP-4-amino-4,6-dideoxygalactose transaminase
MFLCTYPLLEKKFGRVGSELKISEDISNRIIRLPLWIGLTRLDQERIVECIEKSFILENKIR